MIKKNQKTLSNKTNERGNTRFKEYKVERPNNRDREQIFENYLQYHSLCWQIRLEQSIYRGVPTDFTYLT